MGKHSILHILQAVQAEDLQIKSVELLCTDFHVMSDLLKL